MSDSISITPWLRDVVTGNIEEEGIIETGIMNICRNVDVKKKLYKKYESDWSELENEKSLDTSEWVEVLSLLTDYADKEKRPEYRYKLLNTILKGIDIVKLFSKNDILNKDLINLDKEVQIILNRCDNN